MSRAAIEMVQHAEKYLEEGRNIWVQHADVSRPNLLYVEYWDRHARSLGLRVRTFSDDSKPASGDALIVVGWPGPDEEAETECLMGERP